jgi:hypothetical protein
MFTDFEIQEEIRLTLKFGIGVRHKGHFQC